MGGYHLPGEDKKAYTLFVKTAFDSIPLLSSCAHYGYDITRIESINVGDGNRVSLKIIGQVDFSSKLTVLPEAHLDSNNCLVSNITNNRLARLLG